ncbi:unnamed protein product [Durusdinium trenchii]|uniref:Glycosyl transferase family 25 domain-containing protein n=1 Tax=Durusdinium trenchii TaxID=1381693 RepID=A0ABP0PM42_9DINO
MHIRSHRSLPVIAAAFAWLRCVYCVHPDHTGCEVSSRSIAEAVLEDASNSRQACAFLQTDAFHRVVRIDSQGGSLEEEPRAKVEASGPEAKTAASKVGINLSVKWMKNPLPVNEAIAAIPRIQEYLGLSRPIERVKTYDLAPSNRALVEELVRQSSQVGGRYSVKELVIGIGNKELPFVDMDWLRGIADDFKGALHIAIGNEPDRSGVHADRVLDVLKALKAEIPEAQVTVPFAYSIMHRSHPVEKSKLEKEFVDEYKHVLPLLDYFTINIYPFLSSGTKGVAMSNLTGPEMNFLNDQISALRIALDRDFPHNNLPLAIGETGWPSCGAARAFPYSFATLPYAETFLKNVAQWMESSLSDGRIISGQLFTAFDEETKGTRPSERYYGILTSKGEVKNAYSCVSNATELSQAWLEELYPDCESDLDWMVKNFDNPFLTEKFANREMDGSLCSFQQYLYDRWASCPPVSRIPGDFLPVEGHMVYGKRTAQTKCWSQRLADKYSDRGAVNKPNVSHLTDQHAKEAPSSKSTSQSSEVNPLPDRFVGEGVEPSVVTRPRTLPVYWINLEQSKDRRVAMENMFASVSKQLPTSLTLQVMRVPGVTVHEVKELQGRGAIAVEAKLIDACEDACPEHHSRGELLYTEMACSLSHLRAMEYALAGNASLALIMEDDIEIYPEFGTDLERLLTDAPTGWSALQMSSVSTKGILQLASAGAVFQPRERQFYGTGSYIINRFGMLHLRAQYAAMQFQRKSWLPGAGSLQAEGVIYDALPEGSVHTSTHFYFNVIDFPTTVHIMSNSSEWYAVSSVAWQRNFVHRHRGRLLPATPTSTIPERLVRSSFLAMTTLVCRNNTGFDGESRSIAASIRAMAPYNFSWAVYVIVSDGSEEGKCPGLESFRELRQPNVRMLYRVSGGRFSKWVYYTEDVEQFANHDFLMVFDADMGLSTFPWAEYFRRYEDYASKWGIAPVTGAVRNRSPFYPLKAEWWTKCNRSRIRFVESDLVEQWFAMLTGSFATWYLRKVVETGIILEQRTLGVDWGVDSTWCGAAAEWSNREAGCLLIPIDMYHGDTKSLQQDVVFHQNGEHLTNLWWERVPQWMHVSQVWLGSFFQDHMLGCSPVGLEERYHMPIDLRLIVPIVPTGLPDNRSHHNVQELDSASGSAYASNGTGNKSGNSSNNSGTMTMNTTTTTTTEEPDERSFGAQPLALLSVWIAWQALL